MNKKSDTVSEDQNYSDSAADDDIPTFKEAVKERKKYIAELRKDGEHKHADRLAKCRKGNLCLSEDCSVCSRRRQIALSRYPELAIHEFWFDPLFRFDIDELSIDAIKIVGPRRPIDEKKLAVLKASIKEIGLKTPISVKREKDKFILLTGWYRLTAMKEMGATTISCFVHNTENDTDRYLWQRMENVIRVEPRVLERAELINEMRQAILQEGGQVAPPGGHQPKNVGIKKAAKRLGFSKEEVRRSMRIAEMILPEAKAEARKVGLDDNQDALLQIAKLPANVQCAAVGAITQGQLAARALLKSRALAAAGKETLGKVQAIEAKITEKKKALKCLKGELAHQEDRLDKAVTKLVAETVEPGLGTDPTAQGAEQRVVTVRGRVDSPATMAETGSQGNVAGEVERLKAELAEKTERLRQIEDELRQVRLAASRASERAVTSPSSVPTHGDDDLDIPAYLDRRPLSVEEQKALAVLDAAWSNAPAIVQERFRATRLRTVKNAQDPAQP